MPSTEYSQMSQLDEATVQKSALLREDLEDRSERVESERRYVDTLRAKLEEAEAGLAEHERQLSLSRQQLEDHHEEVHADPGPTPPGPECLQFVDRDRFTLISLGVIVINVIMMIMEMMDSRRLAQFFWFDQAFLVFYIVELSLKAILHQRGLLICKGSVAGSPQVFWNWLDLIIVVSGVLDSWVMPLFGGNQQSHSLMRFLRMLRLARLARVLKLVRLFCVSDLSWTEKSRFQSFIMGVICFNALLIGMEADYKDFFLWFYVENALLIIFTFEVLVRMRLHGWNFFCHAADYLWNWLDLTIVVMGIIDQWMIPVFMLVQRLMGGGDDVHQNAQLGQVFMIIRMARLLRILRLVRLIRGVPQLKTLVIGIAKSMYGMGWVLVLTITVLYVCAILGVKLVGHELLREYPDEVKDLFGSVGESMFNLFIVMNADLSPMEKLFEAEPWSKLVMFFFTIMSNWAIFSILTAVVSDHMAAVSSETSEEREREEQRHKEEHSERELNRIFDELDDDRSNTITKADFEKLLQHPWDREFLEATSLNKADLIDLFRILSRTKPGDSEFLIYRSDFIDGLKKESSTVNMRSMMRLEKRMADLEDVVRKSLGQHQPKDSIKFSAHG